MNPEIVSEYLHCDVSVENNIKNLIESIIKSYGTLDFFAANAGTAANKLIYISEFSKVWFDKVIGVNTLQSILAAKYLVPYWLQRQQENGEDGVEGATGCLLVTSSAAGLTGLFDRLPYWVSKSGVISFSEYLAINYGLKGINTVCVCPQTIRSKLTTTGDLGVAGLCAMSEPDELAKLAVDYVKAGRFMVPFPDEVVDNFQSKANDYDSWISGMQQVRKTFYNE